MGWVGPVVRIRAAGFPSGFSLRAPGVALRLVAACVSSYRRMRADRPAALLAMGSYASVGPVIAARLLGVPSILHEANVVPGKAVSFLSRFGATVALSFEAGSGYLPGRQTVFTGFPVRRDLGKPSGERSPDSGQFTVVVMGGSQGAHRLNEVAVSSLCALHAEGRRIRVIHLAGASDELRVREAYASAGVPNQVFAFVKDIGMVYAAADLAVCRSGAATCAELAACHVPALLVPLPEARRDHQAANARELQALGAADVMLQNALSEESFRAYVLQCIEDPAKLGRMRAATAEASGVDATERVADLVEKTGRGEIGRMGKGA